MVHAGQFAILKNRLQLPGYRHLPLDGGWVLSYHERLKVYHCPEKNILLLGIAWQVLPGRGTPEEEIERLAPGPSGIIADEQLLAMEESWCGRYALIFDGKVFPDTVALLGIYYAAAGISSDISLLAREMGMEEKRYQCGPPMNWLPGPCTHYEGIYRLLASQTYDYRSGSLSSKPLLSPSAERIEDEQTLIERFTDVFCHSLNNMASMFPGKKMLLALTGGYDSRTLFAFARKAGIDFDAFTLEHDDMLVGDIEIPKELCLKTGTPYVYISREKEKYSVERDEAYDDYVSGTVRDEDRVFYAYGQYKQLMAPYGGGAVLLRSSIWENVIEYFRRLFQDERPNEEFFFFFHMKQDSLEKRAMDAYFSWCAAHPQPGVNLSNRFLWEQREGCWLSSIEQGFDVMEDVVTLQPVNCRLMMTMLFWFPRDERIVKRHQDRMISYTCPAIQGVPYATDKVQGASVLTYVGQKLGRAIGRLKAQGLRKTIVTYISIFHHRSEQKMYERK